MHPVGRPTRFRIGKPPPLCRCELKTKAVALHGSPMTFRPAISYNTHHAVDFWPLRTYRKPLPLYLLLRRPSAPSRPFRNPHQRSFNWKTVANDNFRHCSHPSVTKMGASVTGAPIGAIELEQSSGHSPAPVDITISRHYHSTEQESPATVTGALTLIEQ